MLIRFIARERKRTDKNFCPKKFVPYRYKTFCLPFDYLDFQARITIQLTTVESTVTRRKLCQSLESIAVGKGEILHNIFGNNSKFAWVDNKRQASHTAEPRPSFFFWQRFNTE